MYYPHTDLTNLTKNASLHSRLPSGCKHSAQPSSAGEATRYLWDLWDLCENQSFARECSDASTLIIWWLFSTCRENVFYSQLETFLLAGRNISICSQKNFWLHRTGRVKQYPIRIAARKPYEVLEEIKKTKKSTRKCKCTHCAWQSTDIHID